MASLNFLKIIKGISSGLIGNIINFFQKLILIPLFIKYLGSDNYASWVVLVTVVSYFSLLDLGCTQAITGNLQRNLDNKLRVTKELSQYIYFFF
jgi:O-antigen/teichoic acid export membrane protein